MGKRLTAFYVEIAERSHVASADDAQVCQKSPVLLTKEP